MSVIIGIKVIFVIFVFSCLIAFIVWLFTRFSKEGRIAHTKNKTKEWKVGDKIKVEYIAANSNDEYHRYSYVGDLVAWHYDYVVVDKQGTMKKCYWSQIKNLSAKYRKEEQEMKQVMK